MGAEGISVSPCVDGVIFGAPGSDDLVLVMRGGRFVGAFVLFYIASRLPHPMEERDRAAEPAARP